MPGNGVSRAYLDTAGGTIQVGNPDFFLDGLPVAVQGNPVQSHGKNEHSNAVMLNGTPSFLINGIPVCTSASQASCGHQATGSSTFTVGTSSRGTESRNPGVAPQFSYTPPETPRPIWVATWYAPVTGKTTKSASADLLTSDDFNRYEYVKPLIWLTAPNASQSYIDDSATQYFSKIQTVAAYRDRMNGIVNGLNALPEGMRVLAPVYYWGGYVYYKNPTEKRADIDTFLANNPPEFPGDYNTYNASNFAIYGDRAHGVFLFNRRSDNLKGSGWTLASIWGATAINQIYQDWKVMCSGLKQRGANIDYLVFDTEGFPADAFNAQPTAELAKVALQTMQADPRAEQEWYGARPLNTVLKQDGKYPNNSALEAATTRHPQKNPSYIYWNGGLASIRNASLTYCFHDTAKEHYPDIGMSNYRCYATKDRDWAYDVYGHPKFEEKTVGDSSSPNLYCSWNFDFAWVIDPYDDTRIIRNETNATTLALPTFKNSIWNCFLVDMQQIRAARRTSPDDKLRPWLRSKALKPSSAYVVGITQGQANSPSSGENFYYELVRHSAVMGAEHFYFFNATDALADAPAGIYDTSCSELNAIMTEVNDLLGGFSPEVVTKSRISFKTDYVVSGTKAAGGDNAGRYVWRITPKPGLTLISETGRPLTVDSDGGAWLVTSSVIIPKYSVQ